jgi:hypothetical protein
MSESSHSYVFLNGSPVNINGGHRHSEKGFQVEVNVEGITKSVLFSNLSFPDMEMAEETFIQAFGLTFDQAAKKCPIGFLPKIYNDEEEDAVAVFVSLEELPDNVLCEALCTECDPIDGIDNPGEENEPEDGE